MTPPKPVATQRPWSTEVDEAARAAALAGIHKDGCLYGGDPMNPHAVCDDAVEAVLSGLYEHGFQLVKIARLKRVKVLPASTASSVEPEEHYYYEVISE